MSADENPLEHELDIVMMKAGVTVPAERKAGVLAGYAETKKLTALLRQPRTAASEPSNIYSMKPFIRSA